MKLVRFDAPGHAASWGILEGNLIRTITLENLTQLNAATSTGELIPRAAVRFLPPATPSKIVCVGRNYAAHAAELGNTVLTEPGLFLKGNNTLTHTGDTVSYPAWTNDFQFEGELGFVIGKRAHKVSRDRALEYILGYTCALDLTARDKQKMDLQWFRAKSSDKFLPLGPWLETELDAHDLRLQTRINGMTKQDSRTSLMVYNVPFVLEYVSQFMTLEVGDVVITGTPEGVGPLNVGDVVEVEIEGIGILETRIGEKV